MSARCRAAAPLLLAALAAPAAELDEPVKPVPLSLYQDPNRVALGRLLFHDARLSTNNRVSCASCHDLGRGGPDPHPHPHPDRPEQPAGGGRPAAAVPRRLPER